MKSLLCYSCSFFLTHDEFFFFCRNFVISNCGHIFIGTLSVGIILGLDLKCFLSKRICICFCKMPESIINLRPIKIKFMINFGGGAHRWYDFLPQTCMRAVRIFFLKNIHFPSLPVTPSQKQVNK